MAGGKAEKLKYRKAEMQTGVGNETAQRELRPAGK
jgi:hypothetical protein